MAKEMDMVKDELYEVSFDGTVKASVGKAQDIKYWEATSPELEKLKAEIIANASPEALAYIHPLQYEPEVECDAATLTPEQWQARRQHTIGGSDVSRITGDNPYPDGNNLHCYMEKIGAVPLMNIANDEDKEPMFLYGHAMESYIQSMIKNVWWRHSNLIIDTNIYRDPERPYLTANLDGMLQLPDGTFVILEFKTTNAYNRAAWADGNIPLHYRRQLIHYMHIMNLWKARIIAMFDRDSFVKAEYVRDLDEEYEQLLEVEDFWNNHVIPRIQPEPLGEPADLIKTIRTYTGTADKDLPPIQLNKTLIDTVKEFYDLENEKKALNDRVKIIEKQIETLKVPLAQAMGPVTKAEISDNDGNYVITWEPRKGNRTCKFDALHDEYPDIYDAYVTQKPETRGIMKVDKRS